jgi:hypothetical protein
MVEENTWNFRNNTNRNLMDFRIHGGLEDLEFELRPGQEIFSSAHAFRSALEPRRSATQVVEGSSPGKQRPGRGL